MNRLFEGHISELSLNKVLENTLYFSSIDDDAIILSISLLIALSIAYLDVLYLILNSIYNTTFPIKFRHLHPCKNHCLETYPK